MSLWKSSDANTSVPKFAPTLTLKLAPTQANSNLLYGNVTTSAIVIGQQIGVFAANTAETGNAAAEGKKLAHAGWVIRRAGTGGRANRIHYETIVAMGSITGDDPAATNLP